MQPVSFAAASATAIAENRHSRFCFVQKMGGGGRGGRWSNLWDFLGDSFEHLTFTVAISARIGRSFGNKRFPGLNSEGSFENGNMMLPDFARGFFFHKSAIATEVRIP